VSPPPPDAYVAPVPGPVAPAPAVRPRARTGRRWLSRHQGALGLGLCTLYLSLIVLVPLAAVAVKAFSSGLGTFWDSVTSPYALKTLAVTLGSSVVVAAIGAVMGTVVAFVLVRDAFPGKRFVNAVIDLPFALPTIVAGLTLLTLY
jgi:sulfate/thiosulfate transport system permease protein